jgi:hypothetical protein
MNFLRIRSRRDDSEDDESSRTFATGKKAVTSSATDPLALQSEQAILEQIILNEETDKKTQLQLTRAKSEQAQLTRATSDLKNVIQDLQEQIKAAGANTGALRRELAQQHADMNRTLAENEVRQLEETLRIMTDRVKSLVARRVAREQEVQQLVRRVVGAQKAILNPKTSPGMQEAVTSLQALATNVSKLRLRVREMRALTSTKALQLPKGTTERNEAHAALESHLTKIDLGGALKTLGGLVGSYNHLRDLVAEHNQQIAQLVSQHESNKILAAKIARNEEEQLLMSSTALLGRVLSSDDASKGLGSSKLIKGGRQVTAWRDSRKTGADDAEEERQAKIRAEKNLRDSMNKNRLFAQNLMEERMKLSKAAKAVAADVDANNALQEENAALQSMVSQLARDIANTNEVLEKMSTQLDTVRKQHEAESRNKDIWISADAEKLDQTLVATILEKEDELRGLQGQIAELQSVSSKLGTRSLVGIASQQQQQLTGLRGGSSDGGSQSPNHLFSPTGASSALKSQLKRSMLMDL